VRSGKLVERLRDGRLSGDEVARQAARSGCELGRGAIVLVAGAGGSRPRHVAGMIDDEWPGALAELCDERVYALLPALDGDQDVARRSERRAIALAARLRAYGGAAASSFYASPADLERAIREAELAMQLAARDPGLIEQLDSRASDGIYRMIFRALAARPEELHELYEWTVAPVVRYDQQYRTELLATLEAYLANDYNMNATARAIYAHRHTVAYRLERVHELSGLDPTASEGRDMLGYGIRVYRVLEPTLGDEDG